jgi:hypothetical protein
MQMDSWEGSSSVTIRWGSGAVQMDRVWSMAIVLRKQKQRTTQIKKAMMMWSSKKEVSTIRTNVREGAARPLEITSLRYGDVKK